MIPVPIIDSVNAHNDGSVTVWFWFDVRKGDGRLGSVELDYIEYRMVDGDPTRLEPVA